MIKDTYTILIGSYARGTNGPNSDLDILRVGHEAPFNGFSAIPMAPTVSYIDYDHRSFDELFRQGSLFLYHAFNEGIILHGNKSQWNNLKYEFTVSNNFSNAIDEYLGVLEYIDDYPGFENAFIPYLSNIFKALKNIAIFQLAEEGIYEFEKSFALTKRFGLSNKQSSLLIASNNSFERGCELPISAMSELKDFAREWKSQHKTFIKGNL